jgi:hypothetical protein
MVPLAVDDIAILESTFGEGVRQHDEGGLQLVVLPRGTLPRMPPPGSDGHLYSDEFPRL